MRRLTEIKVEGLLGEFSHAVEFPDDWEFVCIHGPNGVGKTQLLKITFALLGAAGEALRNLPFARAEATFDDGSSLEAARTASAKESDAVVWKITSSSGRVSSQPQARVDDMAARRFIMRELGYEPIAGTVGQEFVDLSSGEQLSRQEVLARHSRDLPAELQSVPPAVRDFIQNVEVDFIEVNRLRLASESPRRRPGLPPSRYARDREVSLPTLERYSAELASAIQRARAEYSTQSQRMDRSYPRRLLAASEMDDSAQTTEELSEAFEELTNQLVAVGLIVDAPAPPVRVNADDADWKKLALSLHLDDSIEKLHSFDHIRERLQLFLDLLNQKLRRKRLQIAEGEGLVAVGDNEQRIPLTSLSSGEQHEIVLLYRLIMDASPGKLVLIDEPEVSLHIGWQRRFLGDLEEIARLTSQRFVVATHSPAIIGGHVARAVALSDEDPY